MDSKTPRQRSILDLGTKDLEEMYATGKFPPNVTLQGFDKHPNFDQLFRKRSNPRGLATILLKEKGVKIKKGTPQIVEYKPAIPPEVRKATNELRREELELKKAKQASATKVWEYVQDIRTDTLAINKILVQLTKVITLSVQRLDAIETSIHLLKGGDSEHGKS